MEKLAPNVCRQVVNLDFRQGLPAPSRAPAVQTAPRPRWVKEYDPHEAAQGGELSNKKSWYNGGRSLGAYWGV